MLYQYILYFLDRFMNRKKIIELQERINTLELVIDNIKKNVNKI